MMVGCHNNMRTLFSILIGYCILYYFIYLYSNQGKVYNKAISDCRLNYKKKIENFTIKSALDKKKRYETDFKIRKLY